MAGRWQAEGFQSVLMYTHTRGGGGHLVIVLKSWVVNMMSVGVCKDVEVAEL